jgi:signal transduction histidine kinase
MCTPEKCFNHLESHFKCGGCAARRGLSLSQGRRSCRGVSLLVADAGPGIPDSIVQKIFDPFFTTKQDKGTGLGLAISKAIVEKHQGQIRTRSSTRPGRSGTAFRIALPLPLQTASG